MGYCFGSVKKNVFTWVLLLLSVLGFGQQKKIFNIPASVPVPCWVNKVDWDHPNVFKIDSIIHSCDDGEKDDDNEMEMDEGESLNEEPYLVAYMRWLKQNQPFIQQNGTVKIDSGYFKKSMEAAIQLQSTSVGRGRGISVNGTIGTYGIAQSTNIAAWAPLGPKQTYGDNGQGMVNWQTNMYRLAIAPSNPSILYAGSETGVIFKTVDKGLNWISINDALPSGALTAIAVSPTDANVVYCYSNSLIKTTDGGASWSSLGNFTGGNTYKLAISTTTGRLLAASQNGIYYSDDAGANWYRATTDVALGTQVYDLSINPADPTIVYAVSASTAANNPMQMLRSTNGGTTFTSVALPANTFCMGARLAVTPANANYVYCFTLQNDVPKLIKSTDAGQSWTVAVTFTGTGLGGTNATNGLSNGQGYYDQAIMVSTTNAGQIILGTTSAFKSTDGGSNFSPLGGYFGAFTLHPDMQSMACLGSDAYITTDGGVNYSTDFFTATANFSPRHSGLTGSECWGFGQGWGEDIVVSGRYHNGDAALYENYGEGNALRMGGGEDATGHVFFGPGQKRTVGFRDLGTYVIPLSLSGTIASADFANQLWPSDNYYGQFSSRLVIDPRYSNTFYVGYGTGLWKSTNKGSSYIQLKDFGSNVWRFDIARSNPDVIFLCATNGVYKTMDGGINWTAVALPSGIPYAYYNSDISVNPTNENEVWLAMAQGNASAKVLKSTNGGASWVNYTGSTLYAKSVAYIVPQGGTNSGVYAMLNSNPAKVYYRDASMAEWVDYSTGLPQNVNARQGGIIFYRDNKMRMAGNRGTWESPLYSSAAPVAQPMANKKYLACSKDTVFFGDYSMLQYAGASWQWSFPGASYVSSTTDMEPKVLYAAPGAYDVTLTVTDAQNRTSARTVTGMVVFTANLCAADTVAGNSLVMAGTNTPVNIGTAAINSNTFSLSCWIKPNGNQSSFSQLISHDVYPGSAYGFGLGFAFNSYTANLNLCYTDNVVGYGNITSLVADATKWNFVVLTYSPTGVTIYLNGKAVTARSGSMAAIDLSQSPFYINKDIHNQGGYYNGLMDEVKIYNYTLTQADVRLKMHLIPAAGVAETGVVKYVQFNQYDNNTGGVYEMVGGSLATLPGPASLVASTAPVATGTSFRKNVNAGGQHTFTGTGMDLFWPTSGTFPRGEVVGFRLNSLPDSLADKNSSLPVYFILNNYGTNTNFTALQKIQFSNLPISSDVFGATDFHLYKRPSTSFDSLAWGSQLGTAGTFSYGANNTSTLAFSTNNITSFSQFTVTNSNATALPVTLVSFQAVAVREYILTSWLATHEELGHYQLERSEDGTNFDFVTTVVPQNNAGQSSYQYKDQAVAKGKWYYYRLKMIDKDGRYRYSGIKTARLEAKLANMFAAYPNPTKNWLNVDIDVLVPNMDMSFYIYDLNGRLVQNSFQVLNIGPNKVMLNLTMLPEGVYLLRGYNKDTLVGENKIIKIK